MHHPDVTVRAYAKINLDLRILGVRSDGTHELRTVVQSIDLCDRLRFGCHEGPLTIRGGGPDMPHDSANIVWRAAEAVWRAVGRAGAPEGVSVTLEKRIPVQSGLGGGSADAAAALRALGRIWKLEAAPAAWYELAASLGADVPFFRLGGTALGLGRGDEIYPLVDLPRTWLLVLLPAVGVSTADAYRWYDAAAAGGSVLSAGPAVDAPMLSHVVQVRNDLEAPVVEQRPELGRMKRALRSHGARHASMTGSGSAVFGIFDRRRDALAAASALGRSSCRSIVTRTLGRDEYLKQCTPRRDGRAPR